MTGSPADPDATWVVVGHGAELAVGPVRAFAGHFAVRARVLVDGGLATASLGERIAEIAVAESGVREFAVPWFSAAGERRVAVHPVGRNRIAWNEPGRDTFALTPGADPHLTAVHVRFVLRHLSTTLLESDLGGRSVHAVCGRLAADPSRVVAIAGPTRSGKTRLLNRLLADGVLSVVLDDDCPVLTRDGAVASLIPRRYEVERTSTVDLAALITLQPEGADADPATFLAATPVPWPAAWLPAPSRPAMPALPAGLPTFALAAQDESVHDAALKWVRDCVS